MGKETVFSVTETLLTKLFAMDRAISAIICSNEGILKATMEVRNVNDNTGMDISIIDHFIVNEEGKITSGRAFWDESSISSPPDLNAFDINIDDFKERE